VRREQATSLKCFKSLKDEKPMRVKTVVINPVEPGIGERLRE
jgi:hypothetical protein